MAYKMANENTAISSITLNMNGLNTPKGRGCQTG